MTRTIDIFGKVSMGYIIIESEKLDEWRHFGEFALGLHLESFSEDSLSFRIDSHQKRIIIRKGPAEDIAAVGWQVEDEDTLEIITGRLQERGIRPSHGDADSASFRGVKAYEYFDGPKSMPIELFVEANIVHEPLVMLPSGFNTGECGMGHVAITSRQPEKMLSFWQEVFDARLSDYIVQPVSGMTLDITFLRLNPRHHSVAIAATRGVHMDPIRTKIQHFNIEVNTLEDLTAAYQRCKSQGYKMAHGIGQHPNDKELSFYVLTPSGFEMEFGWAPIAVDESNWQPVTHQGISVWGHKNEDVSPLNRFSELRQGLRSLLNEEYTPY